MSVKEDINILKDQRKILLARLSDHISELEYLYSRKKEYNEKVAKLSSRTSSLAKTLLESAKESLNSYEENINAVEAKKKEVEEKLKENLKEIELRENNPELYISDQVGRMIEFFLNYLNDHLELIGERIQVTYYLKEQYKTCKHHSGDYDVPTGIIGIYDEISDVPLISSTDFYFKKDLYNICIDSYDQIKIKETEWYKNYREGFIKALLEELQKKYSCEYFKLTVKNSSFILELV